MSGGAANIVTLNPGGTFTSARFGFTEAWTVFPLPAVDAATGLGSSATAAGHGGNKPMAEIRSNKRRAADFGHIRTINTDEYRVVLFSGEIKVNRPSL